MDITTAFYRRMLESSGVSALVSGRIFFEQLKDDVTLPAIAYKVGRSEIVESLEGGLALVSQFFTVHSVDTLPHKSRAYSCDRAVMNALNEFYGEVSDGNSPESTLLIVRILGRGLYGAATGITRGDVPLYEFLSEYEVHYIDPLKSEPE